ncbi:hypothetical protein Tco_1144573 [Tanacetum coccineum]
MESGTRIDKELRDRKESDGVRSWETEFMLKAWNFLRVSGVHHTLSMYQNLKHVLMPMEPLVMPLEGYSCDDMKLRRGPEFTWEREDSFKQKYPHLYTNRASSPTTRS